MNMYTIRDAKAEAYMQPFFAPTLGVAMRYLTTAMANLDHEFRVNSGDYALYEIGVFDEETGRVVCDSPEPKHVRDLTTLLRFVQSVGDRGDDETEASQAD